MKLNKKDSNRTLSVMRDEDTIILIERERFRDSRLGRKSWTDQRVALTLEEAKHLITYILEIEKNGETNAPKQA